MSSRSYSGGNAVALVGSSLPVYVCIDRQLVLHEPSLQRCACHKSRRHRLSQVVSPAAARFRGVRITRQLPTRYEEVTSEGRRSNAVPIPIIICDTVSLTTGHCTAGDSCGSFQRDVTLAEGASFTAAQSTRLHTTHGTTPALKPEPTLHGYVVPVLPLNPVGGLVLPVQQAETSQDARHEWSCTTSQLCEQRPSWSQRRRSLTHLRTAKAANGVEPHL